MSTDKADTPAGTPPEPAAGTPADTASDTAATASAMSADDASTLLQSDDISSQVTALLEYVATLPDEQRAQLARFNRAVAAAAGTIAAGR